MSTAFLTWNHLCQDWCQIFPASSHRQRAPMVRQARELWDISVDVMVAIADLIPKRSFRVCRPTWNCWMTPRFGWKAKTMCNPNTLWFSRTCNESIYNCQLQEGGGWHFFMIRCNLRYKGTCMSISFYVHDKDDVYFHSQQHLSTLDNPTVRIIARWFQLLLVASKGYHWWDRPGNWNHQHPEKVQHSTRMHFNKGNPLKMILIQILKLE